jgi:hypothetical protein
MLWGLAPLTVIAGSIGLVVATSSTRMLAAAVALPTAALIALGFAKRQRSYFGESIAVIALTGAAAPIAAAGHGALRDILATWAAWAIGFGCSTVAVHRVIERGKQPRQLPDVALALAFSCIACVTWIIARSIYAFQLAVPLAAAASIVSFIAPPPAKLRKIGFAMVGAVLVAILVQL